MVPIEREDLIAILTRYRKGSLDDKKYLAALFDTFLVRVDLYDDHFKITFDPTGGKMPVDIPIGVEDSPESPGDSPDSADFSVPSQDAEKVRFDSSQLHQTEAPNLGSGLFVWSCGEEDLNRATAPQRRGELSCGQFASPRENPFIRTNKKHLRT